LTAAHPLPHPYPSAAGETAWSDRAEHGQDTAATWF